MRPRLCVGLWLFAIIIFGVTTSSATDPPQIVEKLKDQRVKAGAPATFYCRVTGDPPPIIHWRKNGKKQPGGHTRIFIENFNGVSMLRINPARHIRDDATYECMAENGVGDPVTASANLTVFIEKDLPMGFPKITEGPTKQSVEKGRTATLTCRATGMQPINIVWIKDMLPVQPSDRIEFTGPGGSTLLIRDADEPDSGTYECIAENSVGSETSNRSELVVRERRIPPEFSVPPEPVYEVMLGADLNITCVAVGSPMPSVKWRKGVEDLTPNDDRIPIGKNVLHLKNIRETAVYTCFAQSNLGMKEINTTVKVQSLPKPPSTVRVSDVTATSVRLTWSYAPNEREDVTYYVIQYKPKYSNQDYAEISGVLNQDHMITSLNPYTEYEFSVIAFNKVGRGIPSQTVDATTGETKPKSAPRNVNARPLSSSQMLVTWEEPESPNGQITGYKVYYTTNPTLPLAQWDAKRVESNEMSQIHDLIPRMIYTIRVQAYTAIGPGPVSAPIQAKTEQGVPGQPRQFRVTVVTPTSATLEWTKPNHIGDNIVGYELYWNDTFSKETSHRSISVGEQYVVTNLYPNTVYFMWLAAKSRKGEGAPTPPILVRTEQYTPGAPPQKFNAEAEDSTTIRVTWVPPPDDKQHGDIMYYKIYFVENNDPEAQAKEVTISNPNTREYTIDQLKKWTEYKIFILAGTSVGDGPNTDPIIIRTDEDVPGEPQNVSVSTINSTTIQVKWDSPNQNEKHGVIRGYQIHVQELGDDEDSLLNPPLRFDVLDGMARRYNVTDLQPDTKYAVQVAALTRKGDGLRSKKSVVKTPGGVPSRPDLTLKVLTTETSVTVELEWTRPTQTFGELQGYRLKYGPRNGGQMEEIILEGQKIQKHKIQKLERGVEYEFRVSASNHIGYGQEAVKYYTTPEGPPSGPPTNISHRFQTADVVAVTWEPPLVEHRNGQILKYHIIFHRKTGISTERNVTMPKAVFPALEEHQEYWVQISAATSQGKGPLSEKYQIKTEREMIRAPTNVQAMATSDSTAEVWWEGVPGRGRLTGYQIFYTTTAVEDLDTWQTISVPVTTSADLINLEKNSQYAVAVCAKTKTGLGRLSAVVDNVKIKPEDVPLHLTAEDLSTHSMTLRWSRPVRLNPIEYRITYDAFKEFVDSDGMTQTQLFPPKEIRVSQERESVTINELSPFTTYNVNVTAVPSDSSYRPPAKITVTTHMAAPQPMVTPDACNQGGKISLFLPQASEEYGPISHYYLIVVPETKKLSGKIPDQFLTDNMASMSGGTTKVTIVGSSYISDETMNDEEESGFQLQPYIAARFAPRAIPRNFQLGDGGMYNSYDNKPLEKGVKYKIFLRAIVDTPQKHLYTSSPFSDVISTTMPEANSCEPPMRLLPSDRPGINNFINKKSVTEHGMLWVVAPVIAVILAACSMLMCFLFKRRRVSQKHVDQSGVLKPLIATDGPDGPMPAGYITSSFGMHAIGSDGITIPEAPSDPVEMRRMNFKTPALLQHPPIIIADLAAHIDRLKSNDNHLFSQEYESIDPGQQFTWESSNLEVNKPKNRYANVVAYDHSRVVLQPVDGILGSDYINANYCDGYRRQNAYIATQGPLPETFADFWRMSWEVNTATIIMMTRLEERARVKCDQYWPSRGSETYGDITVTLREVQELAFYCIRSFLVRKSAPGMQQTREIKQLQFTAWPDHGVPDHPAPFLMFLKRVKLLNPPDCGPMIVHCSAGVGRTGCFVVIDSMLERMKYDNSIDIYGHVTCLRAQRNYMVQTEDQYIFIYDAILEAVICGNSEIPVDKLQAHVEMLTTPLPGENFKGIDVEFKKLLNMKIDSARFTTANLPVNQKKNRLVNILPYENTRVCLAPIRGVEGSDYINASYIDGYKDRCAYIATQGPLPDTVDDFWRMIWEHNSTIIVMLTKPREMGKEKCYTYWPNDRSQRYQCFVVDPIAEYNLSQYTLREFKITDARDGQSRTIRQFQFAEWPEQGVPKSAEGFVDFIGQVHKTKEQFGQEGPITVHCSAGVGRTGVFIALSIVLARVQNEDIVDLFQTVRILRTERPGMVQSEDQYEFCYRAILEYLAYDQYP